MVFADLVHCCWTVEYDDKSMMKTRKKMYKFCAVPERPGRRPLPPPADDFAAPSLPPRPGGKNIIKIAPPPQEPGEIYDDCEEQQPPQPILPQRPLGRPQHIAPPEEFYDDCNEGKQEQEVYDDFEEEKQEKQLPKRPATQLPPIPLPPEESYDDLENIGPVVVQPMKPTHRTLPPPPPSSIQTDRGRVKVETKKPSVPEPLNEVYEDPEMENARKDSLTRLEVASKERSSSLSPVRSPGHRDLSPHSSSRGPTINNSSARTNVSPKGTLERHLPPVPVSKDGNIRGRGLDHPLLPPVNRPMASTANRADMAESSPVIVNLGHPKKGVLPPVPPPSEKPLRPDLRPKVPRGLIHGANLSENEEDEMLETEERDLDHDDFPPPPSPISGRRQAIPQPQPPPPPPPPIPSFLSSESQDIYEVSPDIDDDIPSTPPLPPKADVKPVKLPPKVPNMPAGGFLVDQSQINALKNKLKKVSGPDTPKTTSRDPKEYSDNHSISELHQKFQLKAKPSDTPDKHALRVQMNSPQDLNMASLSSSASSSLTNMSGSSSFLQHDLEYPQLPPRHSNLTSPLSMTNPDKTSSSAETSSPPVHKNNALMPLPPLPSVTKMPNAVQPSVSKQEYTDDNPEEIYDDASSSDWLDRFDWYHGPIDRKEGEARVKSIGKDGTYLVRISTKNAKFPYTLVVLLKGHVSNLHIRLRNDKKYALGDEKDDELAFNDIPEMISHHKKHHVLLMGNIKSQVTLQQTPPKK
ncbi:pollen-specific leucine-rich repeat extensin-like protein 1 isoform X4 [Pomacea canaliculata]|uniref:pollen-specific leucine-rich repeat extensin-like protein 1 isoform X4 n=1 Tax=Pomacea canaliculata TaxID=400727 RepID=UPI000D73EA44|nr:pollen-specific leucine-rich repeat extensin-like protein 1 isoform X4 [Pomacea canaliculata]